MLVTSIISHPGCISLDSCALFCASCCNGDDVRLPAPPPVPGPLPVAPPPVPGSLPVAPPPTQEHPPACQLVAVEERGCLDQHCHHLYWIPWGFYNMCLFSDYQNCWEQP